jgi:hypothetical protein
MQAKTSKRASAPPGPVSAPTAGSAGGNAEAYALLVDEIWATVSPLIGAITLSALVHSSFRRAAKAYPFFDPVKVSMQGVDHASVVQAFGPVDGYDAAAGMGELVRHLLGVFESIAGTIILKQVIPITIRMEKLAPPAKGVT